MKKLLIGLSIALVLTLIPSVTLAVAPSDALEGLKEAIKGIVELYKAFLGGL